MVYTVERFLQKNGAHLSVTEITQTQQFIEHLKEALTSGDKDRIHKTIDEVNEFTRPFAERLMDTAISHAMKGKSID
jgi:molecular chaperone HscA